VIAIDVTEQVERRGVLLGGELGIGAAHADRAGRLRGVVEPHPVEVLHQLEPHLARLVGIGERGIFGEHLLAARVQRELDRRYAGAGDHAGLALALLPAGGDQRDRSTHAELAEHAPHRRFGVLGAEKDDHENPRSMGSRQP